MRNLILVLLLALFCYSLVVCGGCGSQGGGGGGTTDEALIIQQLTNLGIAFQNRDKSAFLAVFSNNFLWGNINKASLEVYADTYMSSVEVLQSQYTRSSIIITGASATVEGAANGRIKTTGYIAGTDFLSLSVPGTYATWKLNLPLVFTKEANAGVASDWKIKSFNAAVSPLPFPTSFLQGFMMTFPGIQSTLSMAVNATTESSITNEKFVYIDAGASVPYAIGLNPGIDDNTTYSPTLSCQYSYGTYNLSHSYQTSARSAGSYSITGEVAGSTAGKVVGVYLIPAGGGFPLSVGNASLRAQAAFDPAQIYSADYNTGVYSVRSTVVTGESGSVLFTINYVAPGDYYIAGIENYYPGYKFGWVSSGSGQPHLTVTVQADGTVTPSNRTLYLSTDVGSVF